MRRTILRRPCIKDDVEIIRKENEDLKRFVSDIKKHINIINEKIKEVVQVCENEI